MSKKMKHLCSICKTIHSWPP